MKRLYAKEAQISGLRLKRKLGQKIIISCKCGELIIQYVALSEANEVSLAFCGEQFDIQREERFISGEFPKPKETL